MSTYAETLLELIRGNNEMMKDLSIIRELNLIEGYVAAGYIRNYIWDTLHSYAIPTPLHDIDVIYYNPEEMDEHIDKKYDEILAEKTGSSKWSVKNQARMHTRNGDRPYSSIEHAISHWPETATAIAVKLEANNNISFIDPYGLVDLFELRVRRSPLFKDES